MTSRRDFLELAGAATAGALLASSTALAGDKTGKDLTKPVPVKGKVVEPPGPMPPGSHKLLDLPFRPDKLKRMSSAMIQSHHSNNYAGAVNNLNKVEIDLSKINRDTAPYQVGALRERELTYTNSKILHEHYFYNLGGDGKPGGAAVNRLTQQYGSAARWEELFRATAMSLGGGSGWVILDANFATGDLRIYGSSGHNQAVAFGQPLLVLDMYEHSYALDYGAAHAKYIDAFFANVNWDEVDHRLARADRAIAALRA
ncbi:MAG TPA: Fe-Mn family superoxide dismutase [Kofleriaceae bacterium]|nr:Fe-Mn family superoxide dismutase [Kofleriaceae bacterium]